ncbi:interferon-induced GTP-binding protein Mx1-like [Grammomys surdaster]|uniref:interferon-induced GTP-binding protein Mx1-like n=1 Tax=Grammomys surdaster TaxID=491861 RepID=UPI0010A02BA6|nr:interferon-induced GTP-binding protein Mx1-like [Grammomys surdaster]
MGQQMRVKGVFILEPEIFWKELTSASSHQIPSKHPDTSEESQAMESVNNLCSQYEEKVRPHIDLIDSLRALGVEQDLALPAIAVIGDQSSGKSSVLEALSGVALPRGSGIVTRCPLVLKLKQLKPGAEWKGKVIYKDTEIEISDPSLVEKEINKAQDLIAGKGSKISSELISLEVSSPHVPDLTLIDLPGIARVAVDDQPADIEHKIKQLIRTYIQKQETINLVVVPSNVDIATTEALSMAQEVDPEGDRTIGKEILLEDGKATVPCLAKRLTMELTSHIDKSLPLLEYQINKSHQSACEELQKFGADVPEDNSKKMSFLMNKIKIFNDNIMTLVQAQETISGGDSRLFTKLRNEFLAWDECIKEHFKKSLDSPELQSKMEEFENQYRGRELPGFVDYKAFENIIKKQVKALEEPAVDMMRRVTQMVRIAFTKISSNNFGDFLNLHCTAKSKIEDIRLNQEKEAEKLIRLHFQMEQIIYCQDQVYKEALKKIREEEAEKQKAKGLNPVTFQYNSQFPQKELTTPEMTHHLKAYYQVCIRNIGRQIPLIIQYFTLQTFGEEMEKSMLQLLQDTERCSWFLDEQCDTREKKKFLKRRILRLDEARHKLTKFSD